MNFKLLCCASVSAISLLAGSAHAQTSPDEPAAEAEVTQSGRPTPKPTHPASQDQAYGAEAEIVVTGFRAALQSAQELKRNSDSIVDAVVAEDIGKLPDNNAAEVMSRIPGVQITRNYDEGSEVLVRGLPNLATTYNSRELFSTDDRVLHWQDLPASVAAGFEVYKTATADLVEPGLGGLINLRSRRPFDMKDVTIAGEVKGTYNDQAKTIEPAANVLIAHIWDTPAGEIGALLGASYIRTRYHQALRFDGAAVITPSQGNATVTTPGVGEFHYPDYIGNYYATGTRERPSINGMLQWRPNPDLEIYVEGLWSGYRGTQANDFYGQSLRDGTLSNVVLVEGEDGKAASLTHTGGNSPDVQRSALKDRTDLYQGALGFRWTTGRATLSGDFAYSKSRYVANQTRVDAQLTSTPTVNAEFEVAGSGVFDLDGYDMLNPDNYVMSGLYQTYLSAEGDGWQGRVDLDLDTDIGWLPKLQAGFRATTRTSIDYYGDRYAWIRLRNIPLADLPTGDLEVVRGAFRNDPQRFQNWLAPNGSAILANSENLRQLAYASLQQVMADYDWAGFLAADTAKYSTPEIQTFRSFYGKEQTYAAYFQGKYEFDIGSVRVNGTAGARLALAIGTNYGFESDLVPASADHDWLNILPSIQSKIHFSDKMLLRLAYTKTISRPGYGQLSPTAILSRATGTFNGLELTTGNPDLMPLTSTNYDASLEYYFSKRSFVSLAVFYKDLWGFIDTYSHYETDPTAGTVKITRPENAGKGRIKGVEASVQTFFDFLPGWLSGFGAQANLTYLDAKNALPATFGEDTGALVPMANASKWTYNLTGFYEKGPLSVRISYNRRSDYVNKYYRNANEEQYAGELVRPVSRLDASISYNINDKLSVVATGSNLLAQPWQDYRYYNETQYYPADVRLEGRYLSLGVRFKI